MAITLYWGSGSPFSWRVLLALEHKGLPYESHLLHFDKQEHQSPPMLKMNPRGRLPVLKDGDYVVFESVAVLYYLDVKYPQVPIFGMSPEEAGVIMRVICEFQTYAEPALSRMPIMQLRRRRCSEPSTSTRATRRSGSRSVASTRRKRSGRSLRRSSSFFERRRSFTSRTTGRRGGAPSTRTTSCTITSTSSRSG